MIKKLIFPGFVLVAAAFMALGFKSCDSSAKPFLLLLRDTSSFHANTGAGWSLLSCYLNQGADSVELELILKQDNAINWRTEHLIGTIIKSSLIPKRIQKLTYNLLLDNQWSFRITTSGQCFLSQLRGSPLAPSLLADSPFVLPIKIRYENK